MTPARIAIIVVALVASVVLALFVHTLFVRPRPTTPQLALAPPAPPMTRVLVAKANLAVGDRLSADNMSWQNWPAATLNEAYITDGQSGPAPQGAAAMVTKATTAVGDITSGGGPKMQAMVGAIVRSPIYAGEPITAAKIVRSGDSSYMAVRLAPGTRAMSLPISAESAAGGFIQPGDHVDVYTTHPDPSKQGGGGMITQSVLTNALVLAIDQHPDSSKNSPSLLGSTITLEVPEASVDAVARARSQTGLTLALRSYADIGGGAGGPSDGEAHTVRLFKGGQAAELVTAQ